VASKNTHTQTTQRKAEQTRKIPDIAMTPDLCPESSHKPPQNDLLGRAWLTKRILAQFHRYASGLLRNPLVAARTEKRPARRKKIVSLAEYEADSKGKEKSAPGGAGAKAATEPTPKTRRPRENAPRANVAAPYAAPAAWTRPRRACVGLFMPWCAKLPGELLGGDFVRRSLQTLAALGYRPREYSDYPTPK